MVCSLKTRGLKFTKSPHSTFILYDESVSPGDPSKFSAKFLSGRDQLNARMIDNAEKICRTIDMIESIEHDLSECSDDTDDDVFSEQKASSKQQPSKSTPLTGVSNKLNSRLCNSSSPKVRIQNKIVSCETQGLNNFPFLNSQTVSWLQKCTCICIFLPQFFVSFFPFIIMNCSCMHR